MNSQASMHLAGYMETVEHYRALLDQYSLEDLQRQPAVDSWSLGQVIYHVAAVSRFFNLRMVEQCLSSLENTKEAKPDPAGAAFAADNLPPIKIKVPPSPQYTPPVPNSVAELQQLLDDLQPRMVEMAARLEQASQSGKMAHPSLGYLDAWEWYQLIGMHLRHHLRQVAELKNFLAQQG